MGLFDQFGSQSSKQPIQSPQVNPQQAFQNDLSSLKSNPALYARSHGKNIPEGMTDPNQMVRYLLESTQVSNPYYQMVMRFLGGMPGRQ